jgi:hypothetical protein
MMDEEAMELSVREAASVVLVVDTKDNVVGVELLISPEITDSNDAVRLMQSLKSNLDNLGFCVQTLQRHAVAVKHAETAGAPEAAPAGEADAA